MKKLYYLLVLTLTTGFTALQAQNCGADFYWTTSNKTVNFYDSSWTNSFVGITSWSWDFDDGSTSSLQNPTHTYSSNGSYVVCLTIGDSARCSSTFCDTVVISSPGGGITCSVGYNYWVDSLNTAYFTSYGSAATSYDWDFGDGNSDTTANPSHNYMNSGSYGVTLTVIDSIGDTCSFYDTVYVNYCFASFGYSVGARGMVSFTNYSGSSVGTGYTWTFGDSSAASTMTNPTHTYAQSGTYWVTLTLDDSLNNCTSTYTDSVVIVLSNSLCTASFTIAKDSSATHKVILYNNSSNASTHTYTWDFGDGTSKTGRTPIHTYTTFGSYEVCLDIDDTVLNCTASFCDTVGMDSLGNLKAGFGIEVKEPIAVGIDEEQDAYASLNIFPNPAKNQLNIDLREINDVLTIRLMDMSGRVVVESNNNLGGNIETLDISLLNRGIYFILLDNGSTQKVEKFIVAK